MPPKMIDDIEWNDLPFRLASCLSRKASGCFSKSGSQEFDGFNELSLVIALGTLLESSGLDVYYNCKYPKGKTKNYCDIIAESWAKDRNVYIEAKLIWDTNDNRLNKKRFLSPGEILIDLSRLRNFAPSDSTRLMIAGAHSPSKYLEQASKKTKTFRLGDAVEVLSDKSGVQPAWCCIDLMGFTNIAFERLHYFHVLCWQL